MHPPVLRGSMTATATRAYVLPASKPMGWWQRARSPHQMHACVVALLVASAIVQFVVLRTSRGAAFDMDSYRIQADTVLHHVNVYTLPGRYNRYPYPPLWIWLIAAVSVVSAQLHVSFDQIARLPVIAGDLAITLLLYRSLAARLSPRLVALVPAALFAFNPVVLLVSVGHGQFDSLVIACLLLALVARGDVRTAEPASRWRLIGSGLALGVAIAFKGYPVLVLPYWVATAPVGWRVRTCVLACLPTLGSELLYGAIFGFTPNMLTLVLGYRSTSDMGWLALFHGTPSEAIVQSQWVTYAVPLLIVVLVTVVPIWRLRTQPNAAFALIFTTFYATTLTMSVQYVLWALPFLCLVLPMGALVYSAAAFVAVIGFYRAYATGAIPHLPLWQSIAPALAPYRRDVLADFIVVSAILAVMLAVRASSHEQRLDWARRWPFAPRS